MPGQQQRFLEVSEETSLVRGVLKRQDGSGIMVRGGTGTMALEEWSGFQ